VKIMIPPHPEGGDSEWRNATLGGLLQVEGAYYGLTAAHAFASQHDIGNDLDEEEDDDDDDEDDGSGSVSLASSVSQERPYLTTTARALSPHRPTDEQWQIGRRIVYLVPWTRPVVEVELPYVLGEVPAAPQQRHASSFAAWLSQDSDWTLVKVSDPQFHLPNTVKIQGKTITCTKIANSVPMGRVVVSAGFSGTYLTESSGETVGILLPGTSRMVPAWTIEHASRKCTTDPTRPDYANLPEPGDCGAWVINPEDGKVYGMIVASSSRTSTSYCIPMAKIMDQIKTDLGPGAELPILASSAQEDSSPPDPVETPDDLREPESRLSTGKVGGIENADNNDEGLGHDGATESVR
jgi:hypothetical protein